MLLAIVGSMAVYGTPRAVSKPESSLVPLSNTNNGSDEPFLTKFTSAIIAVEADEEKK